MPDDTPVLSQPTDQFMVGATSQPSVAFPEEGNPADVPQPDLGGGAPPPPPIPQPPPQPPPREPGTSTIAQNPPKSKAEFFRSMLGDFLYSVGKGLSAQNRENPNAGAGAAMGALHERDIQHQQLEIARQQAQGMAAYHGAQAEALKNRYGPATWIDEQGTPHQMSAQDFARLKAAQATGQSRENVADTNAAAKKDVANINAQKGPAAQKVLSEAKDAFDKGDMEGYKAKLKEAGELSAATTKPKSATDNDLYAAANKGDKDAIAILKAKNADKQAVAAVRNSSRGVEALVYDENGNPATKFMPMSEAFKQGLSSGSQGGKNLSKIAQIEDIEFSSTKLRDAIKGLDKGFSPDQVAKLQLALGSNDDGVVHGAMQALANQSLTGPQQDFLLWVSNINERALSLRNIAGQGQGAQDTRNAIRSLLPGATTGNTDFMLKKLAAFDNQVSILKGGIPRAGGGKGGGGTAKATGKLSEAEARDYFQKAGGDPNKARAMAKKDGRTF